MQCEANIARSIFFCFLFEWTRCLRFESQCRHILFLYRLHNRTYTWLLPITHMRNCMWLLTHVVDNSYDCYRSVLIVLTLHFKCKSVFCFLPYSGFQDCMHITGTNPSACAITYIFRLLSSFPWSSQSHLVDNGKFVFYGHSICNWLASQPNASILNRVICRCYARTTKMQEKWKHRGCMLMLRWN